MSDPIEWSPVKVKLSALTFWADNPKTLTKAQAAKLEASTKKLGRAGILSVGPAFADGKRDLYDGHQRAVIWRTLYGADFEVWCLEASRALTVDERKNVAVLMAVAVGSFDWDKLSGWDDLQSYGLDSALLADWKRDTAALDNFLKSELPEPADAEPQIDRAAELNEKWQVKTGDLWRIGDHRLLCGDSTKREDVGRVMDGERADLFVTDPPYGVDYSALRTSQAENRRTTVEYQDIEADKFTGEELQKFLESVFSNCKDFLVENAAWYLWHAQLTQGFFAAAAAAAAADILIHRQIIWVKPSFIFGRGDYHWKHELCFYGWIKGNRPPFYGERNQDTIWMLGGGGSSGGEHKDHPTQKPLGVYEIPIKNHTIPGGALLDPFAGSGTALVACQNLSRKCRAIEISPNYCAVILERMATAFPGIEIERVS